MSRDDFPVHHGPESEGRSPGAGRPSIAAEFRRRRAGRRIQRVERHGLNLIDPGLAQIQLREELVAKPSLANSDPYGAGWMVIIKAADWATVKPTLVAGTAVAAPYEAKMAADGFAGCACKS